MKFAFKSIVAAAALVAVGVANAASVTVIADGATVVDGYTVTGSGSLVFSRNLASALRLGVVTVGAYGGSTATPTTALAGTVPYSTYAVSAGISSVTYDNVTTKVSQVISTGGATQDMAPNADITATGGNAKVGDLDVRFNADNSVSIFGNITGTNYGTNQAVNYSGLLFSVKSTGVSGVTTFSGQPGTFNTTLTGLALSTAGFEALVSVFGLDPDGLGYTSLQSATANFGTLNSSIVVTKAIPEPSTYALMGLGLVGMSLVARRRAK